jgi:hypothetical protein
MPVDATGDQPVQPRYGRIGTRQSAAQPPCGDRTRSRHRQHKENGYEWQDR